MHSFTPLAGANIDPSDESTIVSISSGVGSTSEGANSAVAGTIPAITDDTPMPPLGEATTREDEDQPLPPVNGDDGALLEPSPSGANTPNFAAETERGTPSEDAISASCAAEATQGAPSEESISPNPLADTPQGAPSDSIVQTFAPGSSRGAFSVSYTHLTLPTILLV